MLMRLLEMDLQNLQGFVHEVVLHELPRGRYRVEYLSEVLIESSDDPTFDACRALLALGIRGRLQTPMPDRRMPPFGSTLNAAPNWQPEKRPRMARAL
jgi:hypothetical protein